MGTIDQDGHRGPPEESSGDEIELHDGSSIVHIRGIAFELPPRERAVLAALARRPGSVVNKQQLLQQIWHGQADGHAVEVTVARLRQRLAGTVSIQTVPRRGYRLSAG